MPYFPLLLIAAIVILLVIWIFSTRRALVALEENINNAMGQIGAQLSNRWDALSALLDLIRGYADHEYRALSETIKARRPINAENSAQDAAEQEKLLFGAISRVVAVADQYPSLKADQGYQRTMDSVNRYEGMIIQSRLLYNDSITMLNRTIRVFPTSLLAGIMGFSKRDYLEANEDETDLPIKLNNMG